jgi:transposase
MKDGRTHLAHQAEHAVDLDTGAVLAVTLQGADKGDTTTLVETLGEAGMAVAEQVGREAELRPDEAPQVNPAGIEETVTDKGYHSGAVVKRMKAYGVRSYIPEKKQKGRRNWVGKAEEQPAVYANRRRVGVSMARVYCGGGASWSSAASRTATRRAVCDAAI